MYDDTPVCNGEIKSLPNYIGFEGGQEDHDCEYKDNTVRLYYTGNCFEEDNSYWNYEIYNDSMTLNYYPNKIVIKMK
ncbi:hypothetical protein ENUP19_0344G0009 [Entamoeba nuttalli]|uniref:Uncharacterized protein n=1 Tax=Entamoeba nuttalli TaxID=412467 RepID=A0ABQ0DXJ0_9EUKA